MYSYVPGFLAVKTQRAPIAIFPESKDEPSFALTVWSLLLLLMKVADWPTLRVILAGTYAPMVFGSVTIFTVATLATAARAWLMPLNLPCNARKPIPAITSTAKTQ